MNEGTDILSDSEERRQELLRQARQHYHGNEMFPAVHPRYSSIYRELYGGEQPQVKSTFYIRAVLAIFCFVCYLWMERGDVTVANVSSDKIVNQIEKQMDMEDVKEVWENL